MTYVEHEKVHEDAKDIIDYLELTFHQEANSNLENFTSEKTNHFKGFDSQDFHFPINFAVSEVEVLHIQRTSFLSTSPEKSLIGFIILANGLRAPPDFYL